MNLKKLKLRIQNLDPKVRESLIGALAGGLTGSVLGGVSASLVPAKYDITDSNFKLKPGDEPEPTYTRDPLGQAIRSGLIGSVIGGARPYVQAPLSKLINKYTS